MTGSERLTPTGSPDLRGAHVLVWGFGRHGGGAAAARFCARHGARITILDAKPPAAFGTVADEASANGWDWQVGDGSHPLLAAVDLVVASPAIPPRAWPAHHAPVTGPEGLFMRAHRGPRVAVTGTKGKSTTARILGTLLGWEVAGNSYEPLLDVLARCGPDAPMVCELSSFQLHYLAPGAPRLDAAIITSLAVDHLDWHPDLDHYHRTKLGVLGLAPVAAWAPEIAVRARALGVALPAMVEAVTYGDGTFHAGTAMLAARADLPVLGDHNARNAALALAIARHLGVADGDCAPRLRAVRPLPHRLETVHVTERLRFVNDSIATTPESALAGIASFNGPLAVILGGSDKGASWEGLAATVAARARSQHLVPVVIGQTGPAIAAALERGGVVVRRAATLADAVAAAVAALPDGGTVLLSPACASFDMFQGFEDRGRRFADCARQHPV